MKVTKEEKAMYKYLNMIKELFKNTTGEEIIFYENEKLYFGTWNINGSISIKQNETNVYNELKEGFYEISQTPKQNFKLKKVKDMYIGEETLDEKLIMKARVYKAFSKGKYLCEITEEEKYILSKISSYTNKFIRDSYLSLMKKLKNFEVEEKESFITIICEEFLEKENLNVITEISFLCEKTKEDDYVQEKMEVE